MFPGRQDLRWPCGDVGLGAYQATWQLGIRKGASLSTHPLTFPTPGQLLQVFGSEPSAAAASRFPSKAPIEAAGTQGVLVWGMVKSEIKLSIQSLTQGSVR